MTGGYLIYAAWPDQLVFIDDRVELYGELFSAAAEAQRGEEYRRHALERMQQAGARITNHESVAFEWARTKDHASFKAMNRLLREGQLS